MFDLSDKVFKKSNLYNAEKGRAAIIEDLRTVVEVIPILVTALISPDMTSEKYQKVIEVANNLDDLVQKIVSRINRNAIYATELKEVSINGTEGRN